MSRSARFLDHRLLGVAAAAAMLAMGQAAQAAPVTVGNITLDASYSLAGGATVDGMSDPGASLYTSANGADYYLYKTVAGDNVFFHTYGSTGSSTFFGARASGEGHFDAYTRASFSGTFSALTATPAFSFFVDYGEVNLMGTGTGTADLRLEIRLNGIAIARDHTTITRNGTSSTCSDNGDGLGALAGYIQCSAGDSSAESGSGGLYSVDLLGIDVGESFTLDYDIVATVSANLSNGTTSEYVCENYGGYSGYGGYGGECHWVEVPVAGTGIARSGDPFNLSGGPTDYPGYSGTLAVEGATPFNVPEPGSLALVTAALAGAAALRRRPGARKKDAADPS